MRGGGYKSVERKAIAFGVAVGSKREFAAICRRSWLGTGIRRTILACSWNSAHIKWSMQL